MKNNTNEIILSLAMFLMTACGNGNNANNNDAAQWDSLTNKITANDRATDSIRNRLQYVINDSINRNPYCNYIITHQPIRDSLVAANKKLIDRAYSIAKKRSIFSVPHHDETLFTNYQEFNGISEIGQQYYYNCDKINDFDAIKTANATLGASIRNHWDSVALSHIRRLQIEKDSLLNQKFLLIKQHQR